jgi:putative membrane protein insertion efficiency factor
MTEQGVPGAPQPDAAGNSGGSSPVGHEREHGIVARVLITGVIGYQRFISPLIPPRCRFYPSCSQYAVESLRVHGAARGLWLTVRRLARCHPFNPGGYDPVPGRLAAPLARPQGVTR